MVKFYPEFIGENADLIEQYKKHCRLAGKKESTIKGEFWQFVPLKDFFDNKPFTEITKSEIEDYFLHRRQQVSQTTTHNNFIAIRNLYNFLRRDYDIPENLFENIKTKQPKNNLPVDELILPDDVKVLVDHANTQRNRALVMLMWDSGARIGEILGLNISQVSFDKYGAVLIVSGKTGMRRIRLIDSVPDLQLWLNQHPDRDKPHAPLFVTDRKQGGKFKRLDPQSVNTMLIGLADKSNMSKNIHPHAFRHGRLTDLAKRGFNEMELRIFAGWEKTSAMPATYLHLSGADIEKKILLKNGIIEDDTKETEQKLKPVECPRCKTKNPIGAKYCTTCSLVLDQATALEMDSKTSLIDGGIGAVMGNDALREQFLNELTAEMLERIKRLQ
ncbi:tyrosine-type recombinase/integrase [Methanosarcina sp. KYL-1]|nr:site-specific integrase [Methanosarcina sp. KYL-1]MCQ1534982.1 tyrosine-type recombinase/integrase [Methanosarcina sp. KYL-1]